MVILTNNEDQDYILIEERKCTSLPCSPAKRVSAKKKNFYINQAIRNSDLIPRAKGKKSLRRQENTLYLNNLLERDECSKDELEVCSNPAIPSIFTEACTNAIYVEPWDDFMNCSGEEQERLLSLLEEEGAKRKSASRLPRDGRNVHVAFSAQDCFQRIDRRLRATLRRKQIPLVRARVCVCVCAPIEICGDYSRVFRSPFREPWNYLRKTSWASLSLSRTRFTQPHSPAASRGCCCMLPASTWTSSLQAPTTMGPVRLKW
uniref:R3H domain containing 4 n=1 Tax=Takifugu rubripes TaxID=31033 RepID=A0A674NIV1_TAKRU